MLPKGTLVGNVSVDPQGGISQASSNAYCRFSVACNDSYSKANTPPKAHFFNCVAWGQKAQFIQNFIKKGDKVFITFSVSTGSYVNKEGKNIRTVDLIVEDIESLTRHSNDQNTSENKSQNNSESDEELEITLDDIYA